MRRNIMLMSVGHTKIREVNPRLVSYNIEMTEVTGGTFWKSYTKEQISGMEAFPRIAALENFTALSGLMQDNPPIDLSNARLRELTKQLGPAWIRVSGTWATKTYYDFEGVTGGVAPAGYQSVLTREQWVGVLDFVRAVDGKLLISVSNCTGDHPDGGSLDLAQAKKIFKFSHDYGMDIDAIEFMNEPNMLELSGAPAGYTPADYARDQDILYRWVRQNYPNCLLVGPCTTGDPETVTGDKGFGAGIASIAKSCTTHALLEKTQVPLDVFRTLNELGGFAAVADGVIFHNTLASSDYGFLEHDSFEPRPNYFAVLLWNRLMGTVVYDCERPDTENLHIYCHSRRDGKPGAAYLIINNSLTDPVKVKLAGDADLYTLSASNLRSPVIKLNGIDLQITGIAKRPELPPVKCSAETIELASTYALCSLVNCIMKRIRTALNEQHQF